MPGGPKFAPRARASVLPRKFCNFQLGLLGNFILYIDFLAVWSKMVGRIGRGAVVGSLEEDGFADFSALMHCGVYALVRKGIVVYVGQSKTLATRLHGQLVHRGKPSKKSYFGSNVYKGVVFDEIWVKPCMLQELDKIEIEMIKKYLPKYNVKHKPIPPPDISLDTLIAELIPCLPPALEPRASWRRW